jgi:PAS domain S-box-containing protein
VKAQYPDIPSSIGPVSSLFVAAMNATSCGIVITNHLEPDYPIIYCNKAFEVMTGYAREEVIGRNCRFLQGNDRNQKTRIAMKDAVQKGEYCQVELRNYTKSGTQFWSEVILSPVKDEQGRLTNYIGVQTDITRRKQTEIALSIAEQEKPGTDQENTALFENESFLASIIETIREGLIVLDENIKILSVNDHFCEFFKLNKREVLGKALPELGEGEWNNPALITMLNDVLPFNNPFEGFEVTLDFPVIGKKVLKMNARQVTLKGQYLKQTLLAIEDITQRREVEQRKDDFISLASHEMKTPLTSIKGHLQLLRRMAAKNGDELYLKPLDVALNSVSRLESLVAVLLDADHLKSGTLHFTHNSFNFDELVKEAVTAAQGATETHRINVSGLANTTITGDFFRLEQVVINLLENAVKYSPGSKEVGLHVNVLGDYIKVAVTDTGIGINQWEQKKIFERFYRVENVKQHFQGIGIGLYVASENIRQHQGTLWVESEEGKGSVFSFTIPV